MSEPARDEDAGLLRHRFLEAIDPEQRFYRLFDHLPSICFFAKDRHGRLLAANEALLRTYNLADESEIVGKTDFDLLPRRLAEKFRQDDLRIARTGEPMLEIVEIFVNHQGIPGWFLTNKLPVRDRAGVVIGVMGTIEAYEAYRDLLPPEFDLTAAMNHIRDHFREDLSIKDLAALTGLSVRQFERRFKAHFKTSPQHFIMKMRIFSVCDTLRTSEKPLIDLATDSGFYDQSAFTKQFRKQMGITPLQYRKKYR